MIDLNDFMNTKSLVNASIWSSSTNGTSYRVKWSGLRFSIDQKHVRIKFYIYSGPSGEDSAG